MSGPPIVCSLTPAMIAARRAGLLPGLARRAHAIEELSDGYRLHFAPAPDLLAAMASVIDAERQCCQFLRFELTVEPSLGPVSLTVTGPEGTVDVLRGLLT